MSVLVRRRSLAYRLRDRGGVTAEQLGRLHRDAPMLEWGSITKTVTARIAERLDRAGTLDLTAPVADYLPASGMPRYVDLRSLMTHTSGLPREAQDFAVTARDPYAKYTAAHFDAEVVPALARQHEGVVGPFAYSNLGYAVLTRVLEVVTGRNWWTLAVQEVFDPLGITDIAPSTDPARSPVLRTWAGTVRKQFTDTGPFIGTGGVHGTFDALERYAIAVSREHPGSTPMGWIEDATLWWHNGHNRDHGAFVGVSHDGSRVLTVHTLGHRVGRTDKVAARLERRYPLGS